MKNILLITIVLFTITVASAQKTFTLTSSTIGGQGTVVQEFNGFGCTGENKSPQLSWTNAPANTQSYAITMYDPNAPTGSGWWHWVVFDIPTTITNLAENAGSIAANMLPPQVQQGVTSYGKPGYGGPCPPIGHGLHQYIITVHALKVPTLGLNALANPETVGYYLWNNTIAKASLVFYYQR
jgi:Raf kinase inhibitor-like YbhB/YbcL family protein